MAKRRSTAAPKATWKGYHNVNLSKEDEVLFKSWAEVNGITWELLDTLAQAGYKISLSWDDFHGGLSAGMYCNQKKMEWAGYTLTAWAGDIETALKLMCYKHFIMCGEIWDVAQDKPERQHGDFG
jgi:hypothetical protein